MLTEHVKKLVRVLSRRSAWFVALLQALLVFSALVVAWLLRFDFSLPYRLLLFLTAPILILIRLASLRCFKLHHGWWRYTGVSDAVDILKAVTLGSAVFVVFMRLIHSAFPRSIYVLEGMLSATFLAGVRLLSRILAETVEDKSQPRIRVLLIGAGFAAQMVVREIERPESNYRAIGCVDDDRSKRGIKIHGVPMLGTVDELPTILCRYPADEVLIAVSSATGKQMQRFVDICQQAGVRFKTIPALGDIIAGRVSINEFRDVHLDDLLGRNSIEIDLKAVKTQIEGRRVLVTGAAGSIGSELCRQILQYNPAELLCIDQSETGTFYLQIELAKCQNGSQQIFCVANVGDTERMRKIFVEHKPQIVFHAAAYKHVPIMERNVHEAVKNNVFALLSLLEVAEANACQNFVFISSDKAVNPTSIMGATKRLGELILSCRPADCMRCVSVRFGNVLGSNGSVVPVLQEQLRNGRPLTITHPEIKRFFMTTHEAVSLVLQAFAIGDHGDTLVLDMGIPVRILDLARSLIRLAGKSEHEVRFEFTGLREGEKLVEELFYPGEEKHVTPSERINRTRIRTYRWPELCRHLDEMRASMSLDGAGLVRAKMKEIIPEFSYRSERQPEDAASNIHLAVDEQAGRSHKIHLDGRPLISTAPKPA